MIAVTVGTNEQPFDRLVGAARQLSYEFPAFVQYGSSREEHGSGEWVDFMPFDELAATLSRADAVVAHAGVGSILLSLRCGRRPIVVPRLVGRGEAVDDHQLHFARRLDGGPMLRLVEDEEQLPRVVHEELGARRSGESYAARAGATTALAAELRVYLAELVDRSSVA